MQQHFLFQQRTIIIFKLMFVSHPQNMLKIMIPGTFTQIWIMTCESFGLTKTILLFRSLVSISMLMTKYLEEGRSFPGKH